jgi:eukaryotic-like serine/threonine-protein kinase
VRRRGGRIGGSGEDHAPELERPDRVAAAPLAMTGAGPAEAPSEAAEGPSEAEPPSRRAALLRAGLIALGLVALFVVAWLGSALWFSPAPLLPEERTVPRVVELPLADAREGLERTELRARIADQRNHPSVARGVVIWQDPAPGTAVPMNTVVQLTTSTGPAAVPVPDLTGFSIGDAVTVLEAAGLSAGAVDTIAAAGEAGVVLGTRPGPGTARSPGSSVELIVTAGDPPAERP